MLYAVTREVSPAIDRCELTHLAREPIDFELACEQHNAYRTLLGELGCTVIVLPAAPDLPDSQFVEDSAFVVDELAILARSGALPRRQETPAIAAVLETCRKLVRIEEPGTLDGGDIVHLGRQIWVGLSSRTNDSAVQQLAFHLQPHGYTIHTIRPQGCLHLKSAVTAIGPENLLVNPEWIDADSFRDFQVVNVDPSEPAAANTVLVEDHLVVSTSFPRTNARLVEMGFHCRAVDSSELAKAEGGLTCCSILFKG